MFTKYHRLHNSKDFSSVIRFRCAESGSFLQIFAKSNDLLHSRLGLIVAGKVERLAVKRNLAKRILRAVFSEQRKDFVGLDVVVRLRCRITREDSSRMKEEYKALLIKLHRCCG
jgi:ribonuclease P protein component